MTYSPRRDYIDGPWLVKSGSEGNRVLGDLLRDLRLKSGLTARELAEMADVHPTFVRAVERGAQAPSLDSALTLLAHLRAADGSYATEYSATADGRRLDLVVKDPRVGRGAAFEFKAKVRGQNTQRVLVRQQPFASPQEAAEALHPRLESAPEPDPRTLARVVHLLAKADDEALLAVEEVLMKALPRLAADEHRRLEDFYRRRRKLDDEYGHLGNPDRDKAFRHD
ncbi:helix-turn-helix transcriptional regulator [Nocardioides marinus]|uniref:Transcriptional regulator with XRE-family HTH domain n=1 Tax=Nocardioides marinus TaxID=374514 RepID=A0A7Z0C1S9_9ACTN|nr:helix-turn-helix transcriptional regulator [Nocardioides marinus]NYI08542.1 transcriptional regulator with XRE-family HTH domain [Nocardioides marinus]